MIDLFRQSGAYRILSTDKKKGKLSHAYMLSCEDGDMLGYYLTEAAKLIACGKEDGYCDDCRICRLITAHRHPDVSFYPKDKKLSVADIDELVAQSVIRPLETDKRIFVVDRLEVINQNQNKLLKTLEEPPANVVILIGTQKESAILPTIKSRAKKLTISAFSAEELIKLTKSDFPDEKLASICALISGGKAGKMQSSYENESTRELFDYSIDFFTETNSAKDLPLWCGRFSAFDISDIVSFFRVCIDEAMKIKCGNKSIISEKGLKSIAETYPLGALVAINERLFAIEKSAYYNGNKTMLLDRALFSVMEEKARWLRL